MFTKEEIKMLGSFICVMAMMVHSFGTFYEDPAIVQPDSYRQLIISCARNNYSNNIKKNQKTGSPRDTKRGNPQNDQPGCVHSGTAAVVTTQHRFKRLYGKGNECAH